jgi:thiol-disulfide isomerase/thioredoxin
MRISRRTVLFVSAGLLLATAGGMYYLYNMKHITAPREVYVVAPEFSLPNSAGELVTLSDVKGTVRVVNFWASWSPYSRDELQAFVRLKQVYKDDLTIIALDRDTNPNVGRAYVNSLGLSDQLLFVFDQQDGYFKKVQGFAVPETLFLDKEGNIRVHVHGPMTYEEMEMNVKKILE